jgi:signal peptidase I
MNGDVRHQPSETLLPRPDEPAPPSRRRRIWLAAVLGLIWPGLGHLYAGAPMRGLVALAAWLVLIVPLNILARATLDFSKIAVIVGIVVAVLLVALVPLDSACTARRRQEEPPTRWNRGWIYIVYVVLFALVAQPIAIWEINHCWFRKFVIPSEAMMDTLLVGDVVIADMRKSTLFPVRRGDIVVFRAPPKPEILLMKRVIGLPGETVELRDGLLFVDGRSVDEPYVRPDYRERDRKRNVGPVSVSQDHYYVLGDHRNQSADSRFWGFVPRSNLEGRARSIWWSYESASPVPYGNLLERQKAWLAGRARVLTHARWERLGRRIERAPEIYRQR